MSQTAYTVKDVIKSLLETSDNDQEVTVSVNGIPGFPVVGVEEDTETETMVIVVDSRKD